MCARTLGDEWRETTLTPHALRLADAEELFDQALADLLEQGCTDPAGASPSALPATPLPQAATTSRPLTAAGTVLLQQLAHGHCKTINQHHRNPTMWRIGERRLRAAVPTLVYLIDRGDTMQDYCIAWAIGRCGHAGAAEAMREQQARGKVDSVRRAALHAWLQLADTEARACHAQSLVAAWPASLQSAWSKADASDIAAMAANAPQWKDLPFDTWLDQLDQIALSDPETRRILLSVLASVPLRAGSFRAVCHIYKMAEMRADAEVFGLSQHRLKTTVHTPEGYFYVGRQDTTFAQEATRPDSRAAYGMRTRNYLLRRGWRTLRLGIDADPDFIPMALGILSIYDDLHAVKPTRFGGRTIGRYGHWPLFNHLLRSHAGLRHSRSKTGQC